MKKEETEVVSFNLPVKIKAIIKKTAAKNETTISKYMREVIEKHVKELKEEKKNKKGESKG